MLCQLCPRQCNTERTESNNLNGFCKMPLLPKVARAALHFWEEPCISGNNGSGTVFFSGCNLKCIYCQNEEISHGGKGRVITVEHLAQIFKRLEEKGAHNINLVTPSHYALAIKQALDIYRPQIPIVYNCGGYEGLETLELLEGYIDIFLIDFKYISCQKAEEYSLAPDYPQVASAAVKEAYAQQPKCVFKDGIMQKGVIIRHMLLPQSTKDAMAIFDWIRLNTPNAYFSFMSQYLPMGSAAQHPIIGRRVTDREYSKVTDYILQLDFQNVFVQELSSSKKEYIPPFDLSGI